MARINEEGRELYDFKLSKSALERMNKHAERKLYAQHRYYDSMANMVCTPEGLKPMNPEFRARLENTKKLRESLKVYSGSAEAASDLLFMAKKEADAKGEDFGTAADVMLKSIKGHLLNEETDPSPPRKEEIKSTRRWQYWRYFWNRISGGLLYKDIGEV